MFLSIVIPIWNDEKFLNECLDSCLDQGLSGEEYEIICVDDGSTDSTPEILRDYAERYPNITVITKQHGPQFGGGRTIGLDAARGDFIWFVDHDDLVAPHAVDDLKRAADANPDHDRIAFPYYRIHTQFTEEEREMFKEGTLKAVSGERGENHYVWSSIIRKSFLTEHGIRPRSGQIEEAGKFWGIEPFQIWAGDWAMMNECFEANIRSVQLKGRPLYHYRVHAGQSVSNADPEMVKSRNLKRRNTILFRGHRAYLQKQRFIQLMDSDPETSQKALQDTIIRLRQITVYATTFVVGWAWKYAMKRFKEKDIFFRKKPKAYNFSLFSFIKNMPIRERFQPSTILMYYSFTYTGAKLYYRLNSYRVALESRRIKKLAKEAKRSAKKPDTNEPPLLS